MLDVQQRLDVQPTYGTRPPRDVQPELDGGPPSVPLIIPRSDIESRSPIGFGWFRQAAATTLPLIAVDVASTLICLVFATGLVWFFVPGAALGTRLVAMLVCATAVVYGAVGLYPGAGLTPVAELRQLLRGTTIAYSPFFLIEVVSASPTWAQTSILVLAWFSGLGLVPGLRSRARLLLSRTRWWGKRVLILGGADDGERVYAALQSQASLGLRPVGIVGAPCEPWRDEYRDQRFLGTLDDLRSIARRRSAHVAIVTANYSQTEILDLYGEAISKFSEVIYFPKLPEELMSGTPTIYLGGRRGVRVIDQRRAPLPRFIKRCADLLAVALLSIVAVPLTIAIAIAIRATSSGPALYRHQRIGRGGHVFWMWKFRSMVANADEVLGEYLSRNDALRSEWESTHKLRNDPRLTKIGNFLRRTSLDELPQLWNVILGHMSLVGPRPIVYGSEGVKYVFHHPEHFHEYVKVRPGMTGLWQICGRNNTSYEARMRYDAHYVRSWSLWLDLYILIKTVRVVVRCEGAY